MKTILKMENLTPEQREKMGLTEEQYEAIKKLSIRATGATLREGYARKTFVIRTENIDKLKVISTEKKVSMIDLMDEVITNYIGDYEKKCGTIMMERLY